MKKIMQFFWVAIVMISATLQPYVALAAGNDNPQTGDAQGRLVWVFIAIAIVAAVVVIIIGATSGKKGKKK